MEKNSETSANNKIERKDADYTGYSEKQVDLNIDKGYKSSSSPVQIGKKGGKKIVTIFQAAAKIFNFKDK
jgi:hypothetical protein